MNSYSIRGAFKPNHNYVCLSCLLSRPPAPIRQILRFKSTGAIGVSPTPDHSVAALLWSEQEAIAKAAKDPRTAKRKAGQKGQTQPGDGVAPESATAVKTKGKGNRERKVSQARGSKPTKSKSKSPAGKNEIILSVPKPSIVEKGPPVPKTSPSVTERLQEKIAQVKATSFSDTSKMLSDKDDYLGQPHRSEQEHIASPDEMAESGRGKVRSGAKAAKRSKKASSGKGGELAERNEETSAKPTAHDSGSVEDTTAKKYKRRKGNAKASRVKAVKSPRMKKTLAPLRIRKFGSDGGGIPRKVLGTQDMNAAIKETEAALDRRDQEVRQESKKERLAQDRRRSQEAPAGRRSGTKAVKFPDINGAKSIKRALKQENAGNFQGTVGTDIQTVNAAELVIAPIPIEQAPVPGLSYGLERVLFNPGVYQLQDPRSRVFNFDPYLQTVMPVAEFDFNALKEYITSSRDESLKVLAQSHGKRYVGSSSSMTGVLAHFHFLLSQWREINASMLSRSFPDKLSSFTKLQRAPSAIFLRWKNGTYAIDADKEFDSANVLMMLGKSMEKLLTLKTEDFERYRVSNSDQISSEERNAPETYHYSTMGDFLMRSQLDAHDPRLPGTGMFDLKTRAVVSIRMDIKNYEEAVGYQIKTRHGDFESFEREYFDMIRAAFLKYSLQVRMGRMDGIFVAYHNIERIFGFQYISLPEMDATLHGQHDTSIGDQEFKLSLDLLNKILDKATKRYPEQSLRIHFETRDTQTPFMYIFAEPMTEEQVHELQTKNKQKIADFERNILGLHKDSAEDDSASKAEDKWADIRANVEEAMTKDEESLGSRSKEDPLSAAVEEISESEEDGTALEQFETVNQGPLYDSKQPLEADHITAATTADEVGDEDEDEEDVVLDEEEDANAEDDEEDDNAEVQEVEEEDEAVVEEEDEAVIEEEDEAVIEEEDGADVDEESEVIDEEIGEVYENGDEDALDDEAASAINSESSDLDSIVEAEYSTAASETSESMVEEADTASLDHDVSDSITPIDEVEPEAETEAEAEAESEAEDSQTPGDASFLDSIASDPGPATDMLALTLTIRNKVNNSYVLRPSTLSPTDSWSVEYSIAEVAPQTRAWSLYQACQERRRKHLDNDVEGDPENEKMDYYMKRIQELSRKGRKWRAEQDRMDKGRPVRVVGENGARGDGKEEGNGMDEVD